MAAALTWATLAGPVGPDRSMMVGWLGPGPWQGTATLMLNELKSQRTSSAWAAAKVSSCVRDSPGGTFMPLMLSWLGAASTQTVQTTLKPIATSGRMIAKPAGIRARYSAIRDLPVTTRWRNIPSARSTEPAVAPRGAAKRNARVWRTPTGT